MSSRPQTNVRVSVAAMHALVQVAGERGVSRERAARDLLDEHLTEQAARSEEERVSHISTVLNYPPPTPGREPGGVRLPLRLDDGVVERARQLGLLLPGQSRHRAFRGYGSRPLTDAVVTAISRARPFLDEGLEDLPIRLRHREALGLWRLTVAATLTPAEQQELLVHPANAPVNIVLREEDVAWHHPWRFHVARHLARQLLRGDSASANLQMLWDQNQEGPFGPLLHDLENQSDFDHPYLDGLTQPGSALGGRGGAAVWRAQRKVALDKLARQMSGSGQPLTAVVPPGWVLTMPHGWRWLTHRADRALPAQVLEDLAAGRVVSIKAGSSVVVWPYVTATEQPVPGFQQVISGADRLQPVQLAELAMVNTEDLGRHPRIPADTALALGLITPAERQDLVADAAMNTQADIASVMSRGIDRRPAVRAALMSAAKDPRLFAQVARSLNIPFQITQPTWIWCVHSIPATIASGASPAQLEWLGRALQEAYRHALEGDMRMAGVRGHWLGQPRP